MFKYCTPPALLITIPAPLPAPLPVMQRACPLEPAFVWTATARVAPLVSLKGGWVGWVGGWAGGGRHALLLLLWAAAEVAAAALLGGHCCVSASYPAALTAPAATASAQLSVCLPLPLLLARRLRQLRVAVLTVPPAASAPSSSLRCFPPVFLPLRL